MAFNPTAAVTDRNYLVEINLPATTIRLANEDLSILSGSATGFFYEGRLSGKSTLRRSLGSLLQNTQALDNFTLVIDNHDDWISRYLDLNNHTGTFANAEAHVLLGSGNSKTNYATLFPGKVLFPDGLTYDEDTVQVILTDRRLSDKRVLPVSDQTFNASDFPNMEAKSLNLPIPIIYGTWQATSDTSTARVPAFCTDISGSTKPCKIAGHRIHKLQNVYINAIALVLSTQYDNISLDDATFDLLGLAAYDSTNDVLSCNVLGIPSGIGVNASIHGSPAAVMRNILTAYMGVTTANLNVSAFDALNDKTIIEGVGDVRRHIGTRTSTDTLLAELALEVGIDLRFDSQGRYEPKFRDLDTSSARMRIDESDIILEQPNTEKAAFNVRLDQDRVYANKVVSKYQFDPSTKIYTHTFTASTASQDSLGTVRERQINFNWLFKDDAVQLRTLREVQQFGITEPINVNLEVSPRFLLTPVADQFDLTYNQFRDKTFQIRDLVINLETTTVKLRGYDTIVLHSGQWTADSATAWNTATNTQRSFWGFWSNEAGYVTGTDSIAFEKSRWQ